MLPTEMSAKVSQIINPWYFYVMANTAGSTVSITKTGSAPTLTLEYSLDAGQTWNSLSGSVSLPNVGSKMFIRSGSSGNTKTATDASNYNTFTFTGNVSIGGNILSLLR